MSSWVTVAQLEDHLDTTCVADKAQRALDTATGLVRAHTGQWIVEVTGDTVTLDGYGACVLLLPELPVTDVTSVTVDGTALTETTQWTWSANGTLRRIGAQWPYSHRVVEVTYDHGYAAADIPDVLTGIVINAAARIYGNPYGLRSEGVGQYQAAFGPTGELTEAEKRVLDRWRP